MQRDLLYVLSTIATLLTTLSLEARAQTRGVVRDSAGAGLEGVLVEAWSPTRRLASVTSGPMGQFRLPADSLRGASGLLLRRLGFRPVRIPWHDSVDSTAITLHQLPATLSAVIVAARVRACPQRDAPVARRLWEQVAARYVPGDRWTYGARLSVRRAVVAKEALGALALDQRRNGTEITRGSGLDAGRIVRDGYAARLAGRHLYHDFGLWWYPPLEATLAWHFADSLFAARHTFQVRRHSAEGIVLAVCPAQAKATGVEGELAIAADSGSFLGAWWEFRNRSKDAEPAGGEVSFAPPPAPGTPPVLLSVAGLFWRRVGADRYAVRWTEYDAWVVRPGSVLPSADSVGLP